MMPNVMKKYNENDVANEIRSSILDAINKIMTGPRFGFSESEVRDYSNVDIMMDSEYFKVDVGAEISYDGMMKMSEELDKIAQYYDPDAYFDMIDSGLMSCWINVVESMKEDI